MKFTHAWLQEHLDTSASVEEIAAQLTRNGLEVESIDNPAITLAPFHVAQVVSVEAHPQADKLRVCQVNTGSGAPVQVVCGAPNVRAGMRVAFAPPGAYVPGLDVTLKVSKIRGVESFGMLCSARELCLGEESDGILDLPESAPVGQPVAVCLGRDDAVFDVAITPNRQECLGVFGIARDLAASGLGTLKKRRTHTITQAFDHPIAVRNDDEEGCPLLMTRVIRGVRNGASPLWMQQRLQAIGVRPISALVDITNYIMYDYNRPLHVYDLATLREALVVRRGRAGEEIVALNGKTYCVDETMTVIGDVHQVDNIAGIMGGKRTGVSDDTQDVLIECAYFDPVRTSLTGRKLGLLSDARYRFERGVDPAFLQDGLDHATALILECCGGTVSHMHSAGTMPAQRPDILYRPERVLSLGGIDVPLDVQHNFLLSLGFGVDRTDPVWRVRVPTWRRDVDAEADVVEDILRLYGYDKIIPQPIERSSAAKKPARLPAHTQARKARYAAAERGYTEAITWSFISEMQSAPFGFSWQLANPISEDLKVMRSSLLPGLMSAAARNMDRGREQVRLFEYGKRYLAPEAGFERATLALVAAGVQTPRDWRGASRLISGDVFDAKADAYAILDVCGLKTESLQASADAPAWFHPGRSGSLRRDPRTVLAHFGEVHPSVVAQFDLKGPVLAVELYLDEVPAPKSAHRPRYSPPSLQAVTRDFAFVVPQDVAAGRLLHAIRGAEKKLIVDVSVFDRFVGAGVAPGHVSLGVQVTLQPQAQAFTTEQLDGIAATIVAAAHKATGAVLRA